MDQPVDQSVMHNISVWLDAFWCQSRAVKDTFCLQVVQPLFTTILRWIYEGELEDTYHEVDSRPRKFVLFFRVSGSVSAV